jgi:N-acetylmuramoyl-L-alanine amidase
MLDPAMRRLAAEVSQNLIIFVEHADSYGVYRSHPIPSWGLGGRSRASGGILRLLLVIVRTLWLTLGAGLLMLGAAGAASRPSVLTVRLGGDADGTRFVMEMTAPTAYKVFTLANPYRVVIDLPEITWSAAPARLPAGGVGLVRDYRYGLFAPGTMRIVLDIGGPVRVGGAFFIPPRDGRQARFVLDLQPIDPAGFAVEGRKVFQPGQVTTAPPPAPQVSASTSAAALPAPPPAAVVTPPPAAPVSEPQRVAAQPLAPPPPLPQAETASMAVRTLPPLPAPGEPPGLPRRDKGSRPTIVIDPGHGGVDPGTIGVGGIFEKNITMAVAKELKRQLEQTGRYRVVLTRERDIFVPLRERVARARDANADLFISLHADSIHDPSVRGLSIYTLSDKASDHEAERLADEENRADALAGVDLGNENDEVAAILINLAQRNTMNESKHLASLLLHQLSERTDLLQPPSRQAGLAVLTAPDVPAVLIEMGYLSNRDEALKLQSAEHRKELAAAILRGVDAFFAEAAALRRS